ncbi:TPA: hypothetical protein ACP31N_005688, partial [Pseudomonas aeruginosa]
GKINLSPFFAVDEIERVAGVRIERRGQGRPRLEQGK